MIDLLQPALNGILLGGLYAAVAVGLSMVFGIMRLVNLAHGDLMILGSYIGLVLVAAFGMDPILSLIATAPVMFVVGFLMQKHLLNRSLRRGTETALMTTLGISIIIQNGLLLIFSPDARSLATEISTRSVRLSDSVSVPLVYLVGFAVGVAMIAGLHGFLRGTYLGRAIRAAADDEEAALTMGVDTEDIFAYAMAVGVTIAGVAGILLGMTFTFYPHSGPQYLIIAFGAVIVGGVGSVFGALIGGLVMGLAQVMGAHLVGPGHQLLMGYVVLLVVLTIRPHGFFGRATEG
jgi:branched-chain amino acid transport system permease protein